MHRTHALGMDCICYGFVCSECPFLAVYCFVQQFMQCSAHGEQVVNTNKVIIPMMFFVPSCVPCALTLPPDAVGFDVIFSFG